MGSRAESHIAKAKSLLTEVRHSYSTEPSYWASLTPTVRSAMSYVDSSELLLSPHRHEESAWILREVQDFAYFDADNGGISDLTAWCEQGWGVILHADPYNFAALQGLGEAWLERSQYVLARIYAAEAIMTEDQKEDEARLQGSMYTEARKLLASAVDYLQRAVDAAHQQRRLTGTLLARRAEAAMTLGNVSTARAARKLFRDAVASLQMARNMPGYRLPGHLAQYLRENEYILRA